MDHHHLQHNYHHCHRHRHRHLDIIFIKILTASQLAWQTFNQGAGQYETHDGGGILYFLSDPSTIIALPSQSQAFFSFDQIGTWTCQN